MSYRVQEIDADFLKRKEKKDKLKYPKCYKIPVDIDKVNLDIIKDWITKKINEQLPDDEIVIDYLYELLIANENHPDIKAIQLQMRDFLGEKEAREFCEQLWNVLISAQEDPDGIPQQVLKERREQIEQLERKQKEEPKSRKTNYNRSQYNAKRRNEREGEPERGLQRGPARDRERSPTRK